MAHSNRKLIQGGLVVGEALLFAGAIGTAYWSQNSNWKLFFSVSGVLFLLFIVLKIIGAFPALQKLMVREDLASRIASSALPQGLNDYFNMQKRGDQDRRNAATQADIAKASTMWLCANSGASYLDPGIYRHWPAIEERLKIGIEFRVILLDPYSAEKGFRNQLNVDGERFDSKMNIPSLIKLYNRYPSLDIRFVRYGMHATVFGADNALYVDPYHVGVINDRVENRSYSMRIEAGTPPEGVGLYRVFKSHIDTLLRTSESFEEWLARTRDMQPTGLPELKNRRYAV